MERRFSPNLWTEVLMVQFQRAEGIIQEGVWTNYFRPA